MIRINLLPHREVKRRERRIQFFVIAGAVVLFGGLVALLVHTLIAAQIDNQEARNNVFRNEIKNLDQQIAEIKDLREQIDALVARKQVIEALQNNRAQAVHLFNELIKNIPEGVFVKSLKQNGPRVTLVGYAQSNSRVSHLMRNLDQSPFLEQPGLIEVKASTFNKRRLSEYSLNINITQPKTEGVEPGSEPAKKPAGKKAEAKK